MNTNVNLGPVVSVVGLVVAAVGYFGLNFSADQLVNTVKDGITFFGDLAVIYGIIHGWVVARKVSAIAKGANLL